MADGEIQADDSFSHIDLDSLFKNIPEDMSLFLDDLPFVTDPSVGDIVQENSNPSPYSVSSWTDKLEELLMKDDKESYVENQEEFCLDFFSHILDASADQSCQARIPDEDSSTPETNVSDDNQKKGNVSAVKDGEEDDPMSKKRERQLRNRDFAVRSRERKKMYVRDLELKNRYLEGECRRLERLLQCYIAENQALHISLQNKVSGAMAKQESAVLFLESLLLGSLLWFLCIMCLFSLPTLLHSNLGDHTPREESRNNQIQERLALRAAGNERLSLGMLRVFFKSKRCKASRTKMKADPVSLAVLVPVIC